MVIWMGFVKENFMYSRADGRNNMKWSVADPKSYLTLCRYAVRLLPVVVSRIVLVLTWVFLPYFWELMYKCRRKRRRDFMSHYFCSHTSVKKRIPLTPMYVSNESQYLHPLTSSVDLHIYEISTLITNSKLY